MSARSLLLQRHGYCLLPGALKLIHDKTAGRLMPGDRGEAATSAALRKPRVLIRSRLYRVAATGRPAPSPTTTNGAHSAG
jgi:hypothetical protein